MLLGLISPRGYLDIGNEIVCGEMLMLWIEIRTIVDRGVDVESGIG